MKVTTIISILAAGVIMASCSSDGASPVNTTPVAANFSGGIKNTRTLISSNTATWVAGDAIGITATSTGSTNYSNEKYTAAAANASTTFSFSSGKQIYYQDSKTVDFTAYYPFMDGTETGSLKGAYSTGVITKTITSTDETTANQTNIDYLYAANSSVTSGSSVGFTFNHKMCELTLTFLPGNGSIDVSNVSYSLSAGDVYPTGTFTTTTGMAVGSTTKGTITGVSATGSSTSTSSTLILFPTPSTVTAASVTLSATISGITYTAILPITSDGASTNSGMVSGNNYQFNITVNASGLSVSSSSIGAWNSVTATSVTAATS
jgi:hypothetical protein